LYSQVCLALAELSRRGLLPISRLAEVVPFVIRGTEHQKDRDIHSQIMISEVVEPCELFYINSEKNLDFCKGILRSFSLDYFTVFMSRFLCIIFRQLRDASCYVLWAFARAYSPVDIKDFVPTIASALVCTACFDREGRADLMPLVFGAFIITVFVLVR
jgi:hypothetical protein